MQTPEIFSNPLILNVKLRSAPFDDAGRDAQPSDPERRVVHPAVCPHVQGRRGLWSSPWSALRARASICPMNCNAVRRAAVSTASKSRPASGPAPVRRSTSAAISAVSMAAKFFSTLPRLAVLIDLRIAQLAVDLDHVPDQRPESMIFGNLPAHPFEGGPGNGSGAGLAIDLAGQRPVRPVSLCTLVRTVAVRLAALDVSGGQAALPEVSDRRQCPAQGIASCLKRAIVCRAEHGSLPVYQPYPLQDKLNNPALSGKSHFSDVYPPMGVASGQCCSWECPAILLTL